MHQQPFLRNLFSRPHAYNFALEHATFADKSLDTMTFTQLLPKRAFSRLSMHPGVGRKPDVST
jgi:hypothetical protein